MVHTPLVSTGSQILWQMILNVNNLRHIFHLMSNSLSGWMIAKMDTAGSRSERANSRRKILVFRSLTVSFDGVQIELVLVGGPTDASLVSLGRWHTLSILLFSSTLILRHTVHRVIDHVCRISKLVVVFSLDVH